MAKGTALITGGSRGIGNAIAEELASMGYNLLLTSKNSARIKKAAAEISKKYKVKVDSFPCDISKTKEIDSLYKFCISKHTNLDILVNNAGIWTPAATENSSIQDYDEIMHTNIRGMFYLTQKVLPLMKKGIIKE
jgi:short-subunit dehydrogenase